MEGGEEGGGGDREDGGGSSGNGPFRALRRPTAHISQEKCVKNLATDATNECVQVRFRIDMETTKGIVSSKSFRTRLMSSRR